MRHHGDEETVYLAHALVLSYHSEKIKLEYRNRKIPQATDGRMIIDVPRTVCPTALETILEYMYTGNLAIIPNSSAFITQVRLQHFLQRMQLYLHWMQHFQPWMHQFLATVLLASSLTLILVYICTWSFSNK